ncbi:uncharacterized protein BcabD6B2_42560 [Babesia caballi]|uniref:Uncharacterized protein n=1 Tax=Babesia caballi TaxID=5871 RepID=A0AAV4LYC0_BABCB|nr:hypothetical protein, conserved [Babesia caballi]
MGKQKSLTEPPKDLKEAIDWLALVGGGFGGSAFGGSGKPDKLEKALTKLPGFGGVKTNVFNQIEPQGVILKLANGLGRGFLGYDSNLEFGYNGIIQKHRGYNSSYEYCNWAEDDEFTKQCALIFLGCAVTAYYCMSYVYWRCVKGGWNTQILGGSNGLDLYKFIQTLGYNGGWVSNIIGGSQMAERLRDNFHGIEDFTKVSDSVASDYPAFLNSLVQYDPSDALNRPLASCFKLAISYFELQKTNAGAITGTIDQIKEECIKLSKGESQTYITLKDRITQLLQQVASFQPNKTTEIFSQGAHHSAGQAASSSAPTSPAGPVAGTLTTLGFGGGAAAAYLFNLGGAKTLVNGLLKIG